MKTLPLWLSLVLLPLTATASTLYKCTDDSGVTLYTNQKTSKKGCTVISVQAPPRAAGNPAPAPAARSAASTPTPADFPRVSSSEQRSRDTDRRAILERELANEQASLDKARQGLGAHPAQAPQAARDVVALHERNIDAIQKELTKLR